MENTGELERLLKADGFKTSRTDPFVLAMHLEVAAERPASESQSGARSAPLSCPGDVLYIIDPPVPPVVPFDLATIRVSPNRGRSGGCERVRLEFLFYYWRELQGLVDPEEINRLFERHSNEWRPRLSVHLLEIESRFSLHWDTEYDAHIEDCLYGDFPSDSVDTILAILRARRKLTRLPGTGSG